MLQFHGAPDVQHPWVNTPPERFREYMQYLKTNEYRVLALRDLDRFVDMQKQPADPLQRINERRREIEGAKANRSASEAQKASGPWKMAELSTAPEWVTLERPKADGLSSSPG